MISIPFKNRSGRRKKKSKPPNPKKFLKRGEGKWNQVGKQVSKSNKKPPKVRKFVRPSIKNEFIQKMRKEKKKQANNQEIQIFVKDPPPNYVSPSKAKERLTETKTQSRPEREHPRNDNIRENDVTRSNEWGGKKLNPLDIIMDDPRDSVLNQSSNYGQTYGFDEQVEKFNEQEENDKFQNFKRNNFVSTSHNRSIVNSNPNGLGMEYFNDDDQLFGIDVPINTSISNNNNGRGSKIYDEPPNYDGMNINELKENMNKRNSYVVPDPVVTNQVFDETEKAWNSHLMENPIHAPIISKDIPTNINRRISTRRTMSGVAGSFDSTIFDGNDYDPNSPLSDRLFHLRGSTRRSQSFNANYIPPSSSGGMGISISEEEKIRERERQKIQYEASIREKVRREEAMKDKIRKDEELKYQREIELQRQIEMEERERIERERVDIERRERERMDLERVEFQRLERERILQDREREMRMNDIGRKKVVQQRRPKTSAMVENMFYNKNLNQNQVLRNKEKKKIQQWKRKVEINQREEEMQRKMVELEKSLNHFKKENDKLKKIREKLEVEKMSLVNERNETKRRDEEDRERFEKYREKELKNIRRDKKILDKKKRAQKKLESLKGVANEKEKLEADIVRMKNDHRIAVNKLKQDIEKFRKKSNRLQAENKELKNLLKEKELESIEKRFETKKKGKKKRSEEKEMLSFTYDKRVSKKNKEKRREEEFESEEEEESEESDSDDKSISGNDTQLSRHIVRNRKLYLQKVEESEPIEKREKLVSRRNIGKGKQELLYKSGRKEVIYANKTRWSYFPNGFNAVYYINGDFKKTFPSKKIVYYYDTAKTTHVTYENKLEVYYFPNQQIERHYPDGYKEIIFPDNTVKFIHANNEMEEIHFPDGNISVIENVKK